MKAATCIVLLFVGLGVGEVPADEPSAEEMDSSPIFVRRTAPESKSAVADSSARSAVSHQLAALLRYEASLVPPSPTDGKEPGSFAPEDATLQLEKMTVQVRKVMSGPPPRESPLEKFVRTGYLWEFSRTKRFMIGPQGDKVGLMFSFDW
jgi:hypothetical protein